MKLNKKHEVFFFLSDFTFISVKALILMCVYSMYIYTRATLGGANETL